MNLKLLFCLFVILSSYSFSYGTYDELIGNNEFLRAVGENDSLKVEQMLINKFEPNYKNQLGLTGLRISVENEFFHITKMLEEYGAVYDDSSKFISAIYSNDLNTVNNMLKKGVSPDIRIFKQAFRELIFESEIDFPILIATRNQNIELLKLLIKYNANLDISSSETALMIAADLGNINIAEILLNNGADINETVDFADGSNSGSSLINAIDNNNIEFARFLLENKADTEIDFYNNGAYFFYTPIFLSVINNNYKSVELLIEFSANVNTKDVHGNSLLEVAKEKANEDIIRLLIEHGAK